MKTGVRGLGSTRKGLLAAMAQGKSVMGRTLGRQVAEARDRAHTAPAGT